MADEQVLVTREGLKKISQELEHLKTVKRSEVEERLKEAISYGDLSENAEYEEAKNEQAFIEGRIVELEKKIKNAKIIDGKHVKTAVVQIGSVVKLKNLTDTSEEDRIVAIVGSTEADPSLNKISNESPIGAALIGRAKGDRVDVKVPAGEYEYKILGLE